MQAEPRRAAALHLACIGMWQTLSPAWHSHNWDAQVCDIYGRYRGRAEAAHLLGMPQGALLRAALSEGGLGRPQSRVQAAAGGRGIGASSGLLHVMQLDVARECKYNILW